jgi:hypothetical protein
MLRKRPDSRRVVLQMWDPVNDLDSPSKDIPCNTNIYFKIRGGELQMTVCNRSNDMIWGAYGANAVHMSVLQEYIAAALGVYIGPYYQVSDSFHVYLNKEWDKVKDLSVTPFLPVNEFYPETHYPLCSNPETFLKECESLIETIPPRRVSGNPDPVDIWPTMWKEHEYQNTFFPEVMIPMIQAYLCHKERKYEECYSHLAKLKRRIGNSPASNGSKDVKLIGERRMGLDPKWTEMKDLAQEDILSLIESEKSYGDSWKRRGGTGAFMMLARKFDRIEQQAESCNYDVFVAGE